MSYCKALECETNQVLAIPQLDFLPLTPAIEASSLFCRLALHDNLGEERPVTILTDSRLNLFKAFGDFENSTTISLRDSQNALVPLPFSQDFLNSITTCK